MPSASEPSTQSTDSDPELINTYKVNRDDNNDDDVEALIGSLEERICAQEHYYQILSLDRDLLL